MHNPKSLQESRDENRQKLRSVAKSMIDRKKNEGEHLTYEEALKEFLHIEDQKFCSSPSFHFLCIRVKEYLENEFSYENWQALVLAIENFKNYLEEMRNGSRKFDSSS